VDFEGAVFSEFPKLRSIRARISDRGMESRVSEAHAPECLTAWASVVLSVRKSRKVAAQIHPEQPLNEL
jgi:hypothetical protein